MRALVTRIHNGRVTVGGEVVGEAGEGIMVQVAFNREDNESTIKWMADRVAHLRIFRGATGKLTDNCVDVDGDALVISNFTLYGDARHGRRPNFDKSAPYDDAIVKYEAFIKELRTYVKHVGTGQFGGDMTVDVSIWGPANVIIDN